jgi:hypothetical protein
MINREPAMKLAILAISIVVVVSAVVSSPAATRGTASFFQLDAILSAN